MVRGPIKSQLSTDVESIELAEMEVGDFLHIRRVNPMFAVMGTSGTLIDAMVLTQNAKLYEAVAGPVNQECNALFEKTLMETLVQNGYKASSHGIDYWSMYRPMNAEVLAAADAILQINLRQIGFWSKSLVTPYTPSVFVVAKLIHPISREVLFRDRFVIGIDETSRRVMELGYGRVHSFSLDYQLPQFENVNALVENPQESRKALLRVVTIAAHYVADKMGDARRSALQAYEPKLIRNMPSIPLSGDYSSRLDE